MRNPQNDPLVGQTSARPERRPQAEVEGRPSTSLRTNEVGEGYTPERTCVLTRRKGTKDELIRLALGPDGSVAPDVRARAPGRGAWIGVGRAELDAANAKGRLKAALQRAFKGNALDVPADLGERTSSALRQGTLDRLGMEARSGNLINGFDKIETAARSGQVHLLIHAADAGDDGRGKLDQALRVGGRSDGGEPKGVIFPEDRTILSMALGRENVVHIALTDAAAASRVRHALARWRTFTGPDRGPKGGKPALGLGSAEALTPNIVTKE
jgi:uncharacterized protein